MSNIDKHALRERYSEKPSPKCHICGAVMSIQAAGAGGVTYGCTGRIDKDGEGYKFAEGRHFADDHYARSRVTDYSPSGDPEVLALLDELEAAEKRNVELSMLLEGADTIQTDYAEVLECQDDNDSVLAAIVALKQRAESAEKHIAELRDWNLGLAQESFERQQRIAELQSVNDELKKFPDQIVSYVARLGTSEIGGHTKNVIYRAAQKVKDSAAGIGKGE
ncbi:ead/Ea22-like family protein [Citrobacter farmeri]|uniref:ead/Ea22-like family protein n=1 Tax=Citrobacter farmeri TaxID=67824 RepID=UPI0023B182BF|nr:ead/Ea22-like family protein [Citrobacter farmeri]